MSTRLDAPAADAPVAEFSPPGTRMGIAILSLFGVFIAGYLSLYKLGYLGVIQCGTGGCETVQASAYAWFPPRTLMDGGPPVAVWGVGAYAMLLALALLGIQPRWAAERWVGVAIFGISAVGVAFSAWLTYLEAVVIRAWCQWCIVSAVLITLIFLLSLPGLNLRGSGLGNRE